MSGAERHGLPPPGVLSAAEIEALRPRKPELLAALAAEGEPPADWLKRRSREWYQHLYTHDREHASWTDAVAFALDDWRLAQAREPGAA